MLSYLLLIVGFALLIKGADFLVDGASSIAKRLSISDLVIGLTVVAFGTSAPELFVNLVASFKGKTDIAIGNVLGSNIANIFLILGISSLIYPLSVTKGTVWKEIPLSLLAAVLLWILANDQFIDKSSHSALTRIDGLVFLSFFIIFLYYTFGIARKIEGPEEGVPVKQHSSRKSILFILIGLGGLIVGGQWIVNGAVHMALNLGMSESLVGLTIVAVGTSLPELATSAVAAHKKNVEIAVGNVVGSNIFNIFFVLGISSIVKPLPFQPKANIDIGVVILASFLLFLSMFTGKRRSLDRWKGFIFIFLYSAYITFLVSQD
ncbi:MAG: calcium/sodium antiporter [Deltaproteobacteria bacterium]|nr:calcium/sodium antiporter [Deltaproteobacteria bacterium]